MVAFIVLTQQYFCCEHFRVRPMQEAHFPSCSVGSREARSLPASHRCYADVSCRLWPVIHQTLLVCLIDSTCLDRYFTRIANFGFFHSEDPQQTSWPKQRTSLKGFGRDQSTSFTPFLLCICVVYLLRLKYMLSDRQLASWHLFDVKAPFLLMFRWAKRSTRIPQNTRH